MNRSDNSFELTEDLVTLLRNSYVAFGLSDVEFGAAEIDGKRPYGNSDVIMDIAELLGWEFDEEEYDLPEELQDKAMELHKQTPRALQVVLASGSFEPGTYERSDYRQDWKLVND